MPPEKLIIAIDGPAGSGKSTTARLVAEKLGYTYIDTGAMYRAVALATLWSGIDPDDEYAVESLARSLAIHLEPVGNGQLRTILDGEDVSERIRMPDVTAQVSQVSAHRGVREHLVELQHDMGAKGGIVMDGRDIGTVVFPNADVKIFMVADVEARAERRFSELDGVAEGISVQELKEQLSWRDQFDSTRELSPLRKADDAIEIDTSGLTIDEQVDRVMQIIEPKSAVG